MVCTVFRLNANPGYRLCLKCLLELTCPGDRITHYLSIRPVLGMDMTGNTETAGTDSADETF